MIIPPQGTYFIHGLPHWSKDFVADLIHSEICVSLQKDGHTTPLRPLGFILQVKNILAAYDRDVASKLLYGKRQLSMFSRKARLYKVDELNELVDRTPQGKHNELWVRREDAEIVGAYLVGRNRSFEKCMKRLGYDIHEISNP